ncbi:protease SohB, partial [Vibrio parahaemolyticus]|nr:protease SohB [Vibrio parahaemolyticus]
HDDAFIKARDKAVKKEEKEKNKSREKEIKQASKDGSLDSKREPHLFVLDFNGSIDAKEVASLREEITAILAVAREGDEVLLRLESGGGMVHGYGLASSQLDRIKAAGLPLTISVDKVAASGGYMMACVADKIVSAPFAIVGSIGVIAQIPNFNKLLKKHDIEYEQLTAGEYKRTLTMFGENTDKARDKFKQELEETHVLFKDFIRERRPSLDLDKVATGEHWFG